MSSDSGLGTISTIFMPQSDKKKGHDATTLEAQVAPTAVPVDDEGPAQAEYVPDGGHAAWTVVLGSSLALFASAGMINAYVRRFTSRSNVPSDRFRTTQGAFQDYYESTLLPSSSSASISTLR